MSNLKIKQLVYYLQNITALISGEKYMIISNLITAKVNLLAGIAIGVSLAILANKIKKQNICNKEKENKTSE